MTRTSNRDTRSRLLWRGLLAAAILLALAAPLPAQETDDAEPGDVPPSGRRGWVFGELAVWISQPTGLEPTPASVRDPLDPFSRNAVVTIPQDTMERGRYRGGYEFMKNIGSIIVTYWSQTNKERVAQTRPSEFVFDALLVSPIERAGVFDDGLADGFESFASSNTRDLRLDFSRRAFRSDRMTGRWFVGYRNVTHQRTLEAEYFALAANLPPLQPPLSGLRPDLAPSPDTAFSKSTFEGRGAEAGIDLEFSITEKVRVEAGFAAAVLRGKTANEYRSRVFFYATSVGGQPDRILDLGDPADVALFNDPGTLGTIQQFDEARGVQTRGISKDAQVLETYLGFRWTAWKGLDAFAGFRSLRYDGVGVDLRQPGGATTAGDLSRSDLSVGYEGYYLGVSYRY